MPAPLSSHPSHPLRPVRRARRRATLGLIVLATATSLLVSRPDPASAAVSHLEGYSATVDAFTSWYGSYGMGSLGTGWCIDHGLRSPDPDYSYAPADLSGVSADTQSAVAWAVSTHGRTSDPVTHAAVMLAVHDLMGAIYPSGRLDVDRLTVDRLAGFGGREADVLRAARAIKADGLAHRQLRGRLRMQVSATPTDASGRSKVTARVLDGAGRGVSGVVVSLGWPAHRVTRTTGAGGAIVEMINAGGTAFRVQATAQVPHLPLDAWASTTTPAQRIARPTTHPIEASAEIAPATGRIRVVKTGDASAWLPVTGARFRIERQAGGAALHTLTVGRDGTAGPVVVPIGTYRVVEVEAPAGYDAAGPWTVEVRPGATATVEAANAARRGRLRLIKVDSETGAPVAGAAFAVRYDADADGTYETLIAELETAEEPALLEGLLPGRYEVTEVRAPAGYVAARAPRVVDLAPEQLLEVVIPNAPEPTPVTTTTTMPTPAAVPPPVVGQPAPPVLISRPPGPAPSLPRTGVDTVTMALFATGLILVGGALVDVAKVRSAERARRA